MDKEISPAEIKRASRKRWLIAGACLTAAVAGFLLLRYAVKPVLRAATITTAVVERGNVENTISASGEILPEFEEVITSPVSAAIREIHEDAGATVTPGQPILQLDKTAAQAEYEKGKFQLEAKQNDLRRLRLELDKSYFDLKSNNSIKQLRIASLQAAVENARRLFKAGGGTREDIEQAEMELKVARLEKEQLENEIKSKQQTMQVEIRESQIAIAIQQQELQTLYSKLSRATITAGRGGVITWVNRNIGAAIREGEELVRIADLGSFKVTGSISDTYLNRLHNGMTAIVRVGNEDVRGSITTVHPAVQNGVVTFDIALQQRNHQLLRPRMKAEVFLVTATVSNVLRVANGPAFKTAGLQEIFVVKNGKAYRRRVQTGLSNFDYIELKDNIQAGEVVVTSDMSEFKHAREIAIQ